MHTNSHYSFSKLKFVKFFCKGSSQNYSLPPKLLYIYSIMKIALNPSYYYHIESNPRTKVFCASAALTFNGAAKHEVIVM